MTYCYACRFCEITSSQDTQAMMKCSNPANYDHDVPYNGILWGNGCENGEEVV